MSLQEAWEGQAENWVRWARKPGFDSYWTFHRDPFHASLPPPGRKTLDLGCGEGRVTRDLRALGHTVLGLDSAPSMIAAAQQADPDGAYVLANAAELPFEDGSFDLVVAFMSLMDMDDMPGAVAEVGRVLQPGGRLCAALAHPINTGGRFETKDPPVFVIADYLAERRLSDEIERDGLVMTFNARHFPLAAHAEALEAAGFMLERMREIYDDEDPGWRRVPMFLDYVALKA